MHGARVHRFGCPWTKLRIHFLVVCVAQRIGVHFETLPDVACKPFSSSSSYGDPAAAAIEAHTVPLTDPQYLVGLLPIVGNVSMQANGSVDFARGDSVDGSTSAQGAGVGRQNVIDALGLGRLRKQGEAGRT